MTTAEPSRDNHVISGMRKSCTVFVYVDMKAAMEGKVSVAPFFVCILLTVSVFSNVTQA